MLDPWFKRRYPLKHLKKLLYWPWAEYRVLRDADAVFFTSEEERLAARDSFRLTAAANAFSATASLRRPPISRPPWPCSTKDFLPCPPSALFSSLVASTKKKGATFSCSPSAKSSPHQNIPLRRFISSWPAPPTMPMADACAN